jgi:hypothetical protein
MMYKFLGWLVNFSHFYSPLNTFSADENKYQEQRIHLTYVYAYTLKCLKRLIYFVVSSTFTEWQIVTISIVMFVWLSVGLSVCPSEGRYGTTRYLLQGYPWKFIFEYFSKICRDNSIFTNLTRIMYFTWRPTYIYIIPHWNLLRRKTISEKVVENIRKHNWHILCSITFSR